MTPDKVEAALVRALCDADGGRSPPASYERMAKAALATLTSALAARVTEEMLLDAKLLMEVSEIRAGRDDSDSTDVTIYKRAKRHWEQLQDAYNAAMKDADHAR